MHATIPKGNKGYDQHTVPLTAAVQPHPGGGNSAYVRGGDARRLA